MQRLDRCLDEGDVVQQLRISKQDGRAFAAVSLCCTAVFLYNALFVPPLRRVFDFGGDVAALVSIILFGALALVAYFHSRAVRYGYVAVTTVVLCAAGLPLAWVGLQTEDPLALVVSAVFFYVETECGFLLALMSCCEVSSERRVAVVTAAVAAAYGASLALAAVPLLGAVVVGLCMPVASLFFSQVAGRHIFTLVNQSEPAATARIAMPSTMLPFSHSLFLVLLLFQFVFGYSITIEHQALVAPWPLLLLAVLFVVVALGVWRPRLDGLLRIEILLVIMGLVALGWVEPFLASTASVFLGSANGVYLVFLVASLSAAAARNPATSLIVFAWGWSLSEVGIVLGANAAVWTPALLQPFCAFGLMVIFLVLALFGLRRFSADDAAEGITTSAIDTQGKDEVGEGAAAGSLEARCARAAARFGLTPREAEIVALLAQGRNGVRIQEALVITRNTYKTHVRHIYEKMGVHDQQEVMDLVQGFGDRPVDRD